MATELQLTTDDGEQLEAQYDGPDSARIALVLAHPHPSYGGDMHVPIIDSLFRQAGDSAMARIRFNFRGAGRSTGVHDGGDAERLDVAAAAAELHRRHPNAALVLIGYSFGADVILGAPVPDVAARVLVAPPLRFRPDGVAITEPTLMMVPEHDQFGSFERALHVTEDWPQAHVLEIPGCDHFLAGAVDDITDAALGWIAGF